MENVPNLGGDPSARACRDAVHVAVAPVVAGCDLEPGQHVGLVAGQAVPEGADLESIGVVDPFRRETIKQGQRFWLFVYPNTVTSLRHVWTHPAFILSTHGTKA